MIKKRLHTEIFEDVARPDAPSGPYFIKLFGRPVFIPLPGLWPDWGEPGEQRIVFPVPVLLAGPDPVLVLLAGPEEECFSLFLCFCSVKNINQNFSNI